MSDIGQSVLLREAVRQIVDGLLQRFLRSFEFRFTVGGVSIGILLSAAGTSIGLTLSNPEEECQSPDPEPNKAQSADTGTLG